MLKVYRKPLDSYDEVGMPQEMLAYLSHNGWHFNKKMCEFACSKMYKLDPNTQQPIPITPYTKEQVDALLQKFNIKLENKIGYDYIYVANMCKADFYGSSISDEHRLALYIKDVIDDPDAPDGTTMRRWYVTMVAAGEPIEWTDML